jgi:CubicO group peptidase (beta-lactamase class C family)
MTDIRTAARVFVAALLLSAPAAADLSAAQRTMLDTKIEHLRHHARVPGLAIGIVDGGVPVYARGFSVRDLAI